MKGYNRGSMKSLKLSKPHCLIMIGIPGSGKTTFAERFSDTFSAPFLNVPNLRAGQASLQVAEDLLIEFCKTKQTLLYEGLGGSRAERAAVAKLVRSYGYEPLYVWVQTDINKAMQRMTKSTSRQPAQMTVDEFNDSVAKFTQPNASEKGIVLSGMHTYATQAKSVLKRLSASTNPRPINPASRPSSQNRLTIQ